LPKIIRWYAAAFAQWLRRGLDFGRSASRWEARSDRGAGARGGFDPDRAVEQPDPLAHTHQTESSGVGPRVKSIAVIANDELDRGRALRGFDYGSLRVAVLDRIGQRLLDDPVDRSLKLGRLPCQLAALLVGEIERGVDLEAVATRPFAKRFDRRFEAQVNHRCGAQVCDQ
jgi:hypothetical protein